MLSETKVDLQDRMGKALKSLSDQLKSVRAGRASTSFLDSVMVEVYGDNLPISQLGTVTAQDSRMLVIQVWDKSVVKNIEKAISASDLGVNPASDGQLIRIAIPPLSEERRKDLVKLSGKYAEQSKIAIRNIRRDALEKAKRMEKEHSLSEDELKKFSDETQKITDEYIKKIDIALSDKEKEIMHI